MVPPDSEAGADSANETHSHRRGNETLQIAPLQPAGLEIPSVVLSGKRWLGTGSAATSSADPRLEQFRKGLLSQAADAYQTSPDQWQAHVIATTPKHIDTAAINLMEQHPGHKGAVSETFGNVSYVGLVTKAPAAEPRKR